MKKYRKYLHYLYGNLQDCLYGEMDQSNGQFRFEGWTDGELSLFRNDPKRAFVRRDLQLTYQRKLYRNAFTLTAPRLEVQRPIQIIASMDSHRVLLCHHVPRKELERFRACWPWPFYEEDGHLYSVLLVRYTKRERLHAIVDSFEAAVAAQVEGYRLIGRPTLWHKETGEYRLIKRGDAVLLPRGAECHHALRALPDVSPDDLHELIQRWRCENGDQATNASVASGERQLHFTVPSGFNVGLMPAELQPYADYARYFLSTIRLKWTLWEATDDGFIQLHSKVLEQVIPKRVLGPLKKWLIDTGIVICDGIYSVGKYSMGYKASETWSDMKWTKVPCTCTRLRMRLENWSKLELPIYRHLSKSLARVVVPDNVVQMLGNMDEENALLGKPLQFTRNLEVIQLAKEGNWGETVCRQGRFHTVLTRMDRRLRDRLQLDNTSIIWADISNSQPLIFGLLLREYAANGSLVGLSAFCKTREEDERGENANRAARRAAPRPAPIMFPTGKLDSPSIDRGMLLPDVEDYIRRCEQGQFYEHLLHATECDMSRADFKQHVFQEVFCREQDYPSHVMDVFSMIYPTAARMISYIRNAGGRSSKGLLGRLMQRYESDLMIRTICERIMNERPKAPILTIHDSIGTTSEHASYVEDVLREEYGRFGIRPHIKKK